MLGQFREGTPWRQTLYEVLAQKPTGQSSSTRGLSHMKVSVSPKVITISASLWHIWDVLALLADPAAHKCIATSRLSHQALEWLRRLPCQCHRLSTVAEGRHFRLYRELISRRDLTFGVRRFMLYKRRIICALSAAEVESRRVGATCNLLSNMITEKYPLIS